MAVIVRVCTPPAPKISARVVAGWTQELTVLGAFNVQLRVLPESTIYMKHLEGPWKSGVALTNHTTIATADSMAI